MRFYPPDFRRGPTPPFYRQRFEPSNPMGTPHNYYYYPNQFRRPDNTYFYAEQFRRQYNPPQYPRQDFSFSYPYEQQRPSRLGRLPEHFNTLMGHAGTLQNGVNMMRQISSLLGMFR